MLFRMLGVERQPIFFLLFTLLGIGYVALAERAHAEESKNPAESTKPTSVEEVGSIDIKPGDRWVYQVFDDITGDFKLTQSFTLTEIKGDTLSVQVTSTPANSQLGSTASLVYDDKWNLLEDGVWKRSAGAPGTGVRLPLKVGVQWQSKYTATRQNPDSNAQISATSVVVARENVKLRSGSTYEAFRIETTEQSSAAGSPNTTEYNFVNWYAPAVNRYVKRSLESRVNGRLASRTTEYLASYSRRRDD